MHNLVLKYIDNTLTPEESNELYHLVLSDDRVKEDFISAQNICALTTILPYSYDLCKPLHINFFVRPLISDNSKHSVYKFRPNRI